MPARTHLAYRRRASQRDTYGDAMLNGYASKWMFLATLVLMSLGSVGMASAQSGFSGAEAPGWLSDRDRAEGRGIRVGQLELHPGIGVEGGFDSNVFYSSADAQSSFLLRVTPHVYISTLGEQRRGEDEAGGDDEDRSSPSVIFRAGLSASYFQYFDTQARSNVGADANLRLTLGANRPVSFTIYENFGRTVRPFTELGATGQDYARDQNNSGVELGFGTRSNIFRGRIGYDLNYDYFEGDSFRTNTNFIHTISTGWTWRFFPQTAFLYDLDVRLTDYPDEATEGALLSNSTQIQSRLGINGALTQKFSLLAMLGYSVGFYQQGEDYESVTGQLEARWQISRTFRLALGYDRGFHRSFIGGFYLRDRGYGELQLLGGGSFLMGLSGSVSRLDFGEALDVSGAPLGAMGTSERTDIRASASLFLEYRASEWLGFNATATYTGISTDWQDTRTVEGILFIDPASYSKFELWLGARAFY